MTRSARRGRDTRLNPGFCRGRNIRSPYACEVATSESADQVIKPVNVGHAVGVGVSQHFAACSSSAGIACRAQPAIRLVDVADVGKFSRDLRSVVGRSIVHQDDFKFRVIDFTE